MTGGAKLNVTSQLLDHTVINFGWAIRDSCSRAMRVLTETEF